MGAHQAASGPSPLDKRELAQETLAEKTGLSGGTLSGIETGAANHTWATVRDITAALGDSISEVAKLAESYEERGRRPRKMRPGCDHEARNSPESPGSRRNADQSLG